MVATSAVPATSAFESIRSDAIHAGISKRLIPEMDVASAVNLIHPNGGEIDERNAKRITVENELTMASAGDKLQFIEIGIDVSAMKIPNWSLVMRLSGMWAN